jgi:hypothetical protein
MSHLSDTEVLLNDVVQIDINLYRYPPIYRQYSRQKTVVKIS